MLLSVEGLNATEKSTLALTAPLPIVFFAFDLGHSRAWHGFYHDYFESLNIKVVKYDRNAQITLDWKEREAPKSVPEGLGHVAKPGQPWDIIIYEMPSPPQLDNIIMKGALQLWGRFVARMGEAVLEIDDVVNTLAVDTMTVARRVKNDAYLQALQEKWIAENNWTLESGRPYQGREKLLQIEYGPGNDAIRDMYNACQGMGKNLVAIHHLTDVYAMTEITDQQGRTRKESVPTGELTLEGLNKTHNLVDVAVRSVKAKDFQSQAQTVTTTFLKCGYDLSLENQALLNPSWNSIANRINMSPFNSESIPTNDLFAAWQQVQREKATASSAS